MNAQKQYHHFPAFCSFIFPGFGQLVKGEIGKVIFLWVILFLLDAVILYYFVDNIRMLFQLNYASGVSILNAILKLAFPIFLAFLHLCIWLYQIHDAYVEQI